MIVTFGFVSMLLAGGPGVHDHAADDEVASSGGVYAVEACRGRCEAENRRMLYRGHVVLLDGVVNLEELRGRTGWTAAKFPSGSNGCLVVRQYRDDGSDDPLAEPRGFNAAVTWSRTEGGGLAFTFTNDAGEPVAAALERRGVNWVGRLRPEVPASGTAPEGDQIVIWQVGNGGTEHCVTLAK
ncbi:MAG TPA: hypothetical protein VF139_07145 [Candidatus Polarisedimenticolaceae bacterium]